MTACDWKRWNPAIDLCDPFYSPEVERFDVRLERFGLIDLFDGMLSDRYVAAVFGVIGKAPMQQFKVETRFPLSAKGWFEWVQAEGYPINVLAHALDDFCFSRGDACFLNDAPTLGDAWPLPNVAIGVRVESQEEADRLVPDLLTVPAAVRFVTVAGRAGEIDLSRWPEVLVEREPEVRA